VTLGLELDSRIVDILTVDVREGSTRLDTSVLEALKHIHHVRRMNTAGTRTAAQEVVGVLTEEGDGFDER
jgi:hypothetical protein